MRFPYELQLGWRYIRAGRTTRRNGFISFISSISMLGITLGVATLIIVLSVMNGFQKEVRDRMLSVIPHIEIFSPDGQALDGIGLITQTVLQNPQVVAATPFIATQALLANGENMKGALVRGIDPKLEPNVTRVLAGKQGAALAHLQAGEFGIVLGSDLARSLYVGPGDKITLIAPGGQVTPAGVLPRLKQFTVVGLFNSGHYEYDSTLAMIHMQDAQRMFRLGGPTGIQLRLKDQHQAPEVADQLAATLIPLWLKSLPQEPYVVQRLSEILQFFELPQAPDMAGQITTILKFLHQGPKATGQFAAMLPEQFGVGFNIRDWTRQNPTWFAAVQVEKRMMFIILSLIIAIAAFNLVSTLVMTVIDKRADIAILRTLGASPGSVMSIFVVQGALVGVIGTFGGLLLGLLVAYNIDVIVPALEHLLHTTFLPKDIYLISRMPSDPQRSDIVPITLISLLLAFVATLYPSWRASRVNPAEALRYE
ncbi:MAG: ABC transporter permease [Burkholderiaceae bacterium]|jgi:lipoprotein-releasing system permease protein|nr:ABC transporter permease [Burkholderiaceae bacterium]